jgi:protein SCO1/2
MKTKSALIFFGLLAGSLGGNLLAGEAVEPARARTLLPEAAPACCATEPAPMAKDAPACCAVVEKQSACCDELAGGAPLTARSLYQLDAPWTDDAGKSVKLMSLRGSPVVVAMMFASCEYACPVLVNDLQRLRAALPAAVREKTRFVLVSFDVARDTPAVLAAYRVKRALDGGWTLLRGEAAAVQDLAMLLGVSYKQDARGQFAHSNLFTVLNAEGEIAHRQPGLQGEIGDSARAVASVAKK